MWKIYYYLRDGCDRTCDPIDPDTLPIVMATEIESKINFLSPNQQTYKVHDTAEAVDFRFHYSVKISKHVKDDDLQAFKNLIEKSWKCKIFFCMY